MTAPDDPSAELDRLAEEFVDRARRGEAPSIEDYAETHPDLADDIRELFPVLAIVEGLKGESVPRRSTVNDLEPPPPPRGRAAPERIGPWRIVREIGRGGMGTVYEGAGEGEAAGERVAVKVVHPHLLDRPEFVARFLQEAEAGRRVSHPNVIETLDTGLLDADGDEVPYIVLEYVEGQNLRALLAEVEVVPERLCRLVARRLAGALRAVHAAGLVHRDVKPDNVVITTDETVKLMDMGVAVLQEEANRLSQTGQFVGSLLYAAPEQIAGEAPDPRWDLYALGILLYELSTGRHPARTLGTRWLARGKGHRGATSPRDANPRLSPFFDALVRTLLSPDADGRLASAKELADVLDEDERSTWWRSRRREAATPEAALISVERPTSFVGRTAEWARLDERLADARSGTGAVVLVLGDAGIGKTRLVYEWLTASQDAPEAPQVIVVPHGPGVIGGDEGGLAAALLEKLGTADLEHRLRQLLASRAALAAQLARHLRGTAPSGTVPDLDPSSLDAAYLHLLRALAKDRPLVLVFEDLHFASEEARSRFLLFARAFQRDPVLVVGSARSVPTPTWAAELDRLPHAERLELGGLGERACRALVREAAREHPHLDARVMELADRTDRNPFLLLEFARDFLRRQPTTRGEDVPEVGIPASVREFIAGRLAALEPADRELLEAAACCGHEFDPVIVAAASGLGRIAALKRFGRLERLHGLLRPAERHYQFQHHIVQEVLYGEIHPALRETWHAALGGALEQEEGVLPAGPRALALATHFLEGGQPTRARPYLRQALGHLRGNRHDFTRAAALAQRALDEPDLLHGEDRAVALYQVASHLLSRVAYEPARAPIDEGLRLAREADAAGLEVEFLHIRATAEEGLGNREALHAACRAGVARAHEAGDGAREAYLLSYWGLMLKEENRVEEAEACFRRGFSALEKNPDPFYEGRLLANLARTRVYGGDLVEGKRLLERAQTLAHSAGDLPTEELVILTLGQLAVRTGRLEDAIALGMRSVDLHRQMGVFHVEMALANVAYCLTELGRFDEAYERVSEAVSLAEQGAHRFQVAQARLRRGVLLTDRGRLSEALEDLQGSYESGRDLQLPLLVRNAARGLVDALVLSGRIEEARQVLEDTVAFIGENVPRGVGDVRADLSERIGRPEEALAFWERGATKIPPEALGYGPVHLALGRVLFDLGRKDEAVEPLRAALLWSREKGLLRQVLPAEALLAAIGAGDVLAARVSLEQHESSLSVFERMGCHFALWEATSDPAHLVAARDALAILKEGARPEDREALVEGVDLHRRVAAAAI